jgi:hypothetical protein
MICNPGGRQKRCHSRQEGTESKFYRQVEESMSRNKADLEMLREKNPPLNK